VPKCGAEFIIHDYAFVTHDATTGEQQNVVVVPKGTRFLTAPDLWKHQIVNEPFAPGREGHS
jgi:hypothetical protein